MRGHNLFIGVVLLALALAIGMAIPAAAQDTGGRICVTAFYDANRNGVRDSIEPLLADVVVSLVDAQNVVINTYLTDGRAEPHCFADLIPGTYLVTFSSATHAPTRQDSFPVSLNAGQTAQASFGALPVESNVPAASSPAAAPASGNTALRLVISCAGAAFVMLAMGGFGAIIYWMRYRSA